MKIKKIIKFHIIFTLLISVSCIDDDASQIIDNMPTTFSRISSSEEHNTLEQLLLETNLNDLLDSGIFTIFAATDEAFEAIDLESLTIEEKTQLILYHVISSSAESTDFTNGYMSTQAIEYFTGNENALNMYINVDGGIILNGVSTVTVDNIIASNGVIHIVDTVISIPDITTFVFADNRFSSLLQALTREDQPDYVGILSSYENPAPYTFFAPTDDAFSDLLIELELTELSEIETDMLTSTLNTHVIAGEVFREEDLSSGSINTLGDSFTFDASLNLITDLNGRDINLIVTNLHAANGVMHVVDKVILPEL